MHHKNAGFLLAVTALLVVVLGWAMGWASGTGPLHGMYCTTGFATTAGCDIPIRTPLEYVLGELSMILMVPLFAAVFSLFTTGLTTQDVKAHADEHHRELKRRLD